MSYRTLDISALDVESNDAWYMRKFALVAEKPVGFPDWKIVSGKLYKYHPAPDIKDLMEDEDAWKLVLPQEK